MTLFSEPVNGMGIVIMYDLVGDRVGGQDTVGVCVVCVCVYQTGEMYNGAWG